MISDLKPNYDFSVNMVGFTLEDSKTPDLGESIKIYIPKLLALAENNGVDENTVTIKAANLFCNDSSCKPRIKPSVKTQNYIMARSDAFSSEWNGIDTITKDPNTGKIIERNLPKGSQVLCRFTNETLKEVTISPSGYPSRIVSGSEKLSSYEPTISIDSSEVTDVPKVEELTPEDINESIGALEENIEYNRNYIDQIINILKINNLIKESDIEDIKSQL